MDDFLDDYFECTNGGGCIACDSECDYYGDCDMCDCQGSASCDHCSHNPDYEE